MLTIPKIESAIASAMTMTDAVYTTTARFENDILWLRGFTRYIDTPIGCTGRQYLDQSVDAVRDGKNERALALADQGMMSVAGQMAFAKVLGFRR